jgi:hypothetical protein
MNTAQNQEGFELSNLEDLDEATVKVPLRFNADGDAISGFILVGKNSPQFQDAQQKGRIEGIMKGAKRKSALDTTTEAGAKTFADMLSSSDRAVTLACVVDWYGFNLEGAPMKFDRNIVEKLFTKFPNWLTLCTAALDKDSNFMKV